MGGSPSIEGRRISVYNLLEGLNLEEEINDYLRAFNISKEDAIDALEYCKNLRCQDNLELSLCEGCILDTIHAKNIDLRNIKWHKDQSGNWISEDGLIYILGTPESYEEEIFGKPGWAIAEEILTKVKSESA